MKTVETIRQEAHARYDELVELGICRPSWAEVFAYLLVKAIDEKTFVRPT